MKPRLVLFDIDGTLLHGGPLWKNAFLEAFRAIYPNGDVPKLSFAGQTDGSIVRMVAKHFGAEEAELDQICVRVHELYLRGVHARFERERHHVSLLPGAEKLVCALSELPNVSVALLTGNLEASARLKLQAVNIEKYFDWGVFADDHWDRYQLPAIARERALERTGKAFDGREIVIIGDTVHDVRCGQSLGVKAVAVGTGPADAKADLMAANPEHFFEDLSDTPAVLKAVLGD